jgi:hypothetical protein
VVQSSTSVPSSGRCPQTGVRLQLRAKPARKRYNGFASQELAPRKIRVNALNPGMIETVGPRASGLHEGEFRDRQEKTTHLGRTPRRTTSLWPLRCWSATMPAGSPETACFSICARVPLPPMSRPWGCKTHDPRVEALDLDPLPSHVIVLGEGMWTLNSRLRFLTGRCPASSRSSCCAATGSHGYSPARGRNRLITGRPVDPRALMLSCIAKSL